MRNAKAALPWLCLALLSGFSVSASRQLLQDTFEQPSTFEDSALSQPGTPPPVGPPSPDFTFPFPDWPAQSPDFNTPSPDYPPSNEDSPSPSPSFPSPDFFPPTSPSPSPSSGLNEQTAWGRLALTFVSQQCPAASSSTSSSTCLPCVCSLALLCQGFSESTDSDQSVVKACTALGQGQFDTVAVAAGANNCLASSIFKGKSDEENGAQCGIWFAQAGFDFNSTLPGGVNTNTPPPPRAGTSMTKANSIHIATALGALMLLGMLFA